ncbi:hypothetical protein GQ53DRAFT_742114 [Thozetella sp. PMI_491]|nr:hypothetical protein GQ53DRAFT_742114 [Thozetella sp. PMI_491]
MALGVADACLLTLELQVVPSFLEPAGKQPACAFGSPLHTLSDGISFWTVCLPAPRFRRTEQPSSAVCPDDVG